MTVTCGLTNFDHLMSSNHVKAMAIGLLAIACASSSALAQKVFRDHIEPHWFAGSDGVTNQFWYRVNSPGRKTEYVTVNADTGARQTAAHRDQAGDDSLPVLRGPHPSRDSALDTEVTFENRLSQKVRLFWVDSGGNRVPYGTLRPGEKYLQHTFAGHVWLVASADTNVIAVYQAGDEPGVAIIDGRKPDARRRKAPREGEVHPAPPPHPEVSPDGQWEVFVRDHNLFLRATGGTNETPLTADASATNSYARNEQAQRGMEMEYDRGDPERPTPEVYWAPDSKHLVAMRHQPGADRRVYLVESSPADQLQPKLDSYPYLKPGDAVPISKPHLFEVATRKEIPVSDALFANPWSIEDVRWNADSARFTFFSISAGIRPSAFWPWTPPRERFSRW